MPGCKCTTNCVLNPKLRLKNNAGVRHNQQGHTGLSCCNSRFLWRRESKVKRILAAHWLIALCVNKHFKISRGDLDWLLSLSHSFRLTENTLHITQLHTVSTKRSKVHRPFFQSITTAKCSNDIQGCTWACKMKRFSACWDGRGSARRGGESWWIVQLPAQERFD